MRSAECQWRGEPRHDAPWKFRTPHSALKPGFQPAYRTIMFASPLFPSLVARRIALPEERGWTSAWAP